MMDWNFRARGVLLVLLLSSIISCFQVPGSVEDSSIPGVPGRDYPTYSRVPDTFFTCRGHLDGGYYADPETRCQSFHVCSDNGTGELIQHSFLCPNGTLFQQEYFICDWWFNVDCTKARSLWNLNNVIVQQRQLQSASQHQNL